MLDWNEYTKLTVSLIAIIGPVEAMAVYVGLTKGLDLKDRRTVMLVATGLCVTLLLIFTFFGEEILMFFGISIDAFKVAGGILLFITALEMMRDTPNQPKEQEPESPGSPVTLAVVPLTFPLLVGPGAISTIIVYSHAHPSFAHDLLMAGVIITVAVIVYLTFLAASKIAHRVSDSVSLLLNRLTGLILAALGVEFIFAGIANQLLDRLPNF